MPDTQQYGGIVVSLDAYRNRTQVAEEQQPTLYTDLAVERVSFLGVRQMMEDLGIEQNQRGLSLVYRFIPSDESEVLSPEGRPFHYALEISNQKRKDVLGSLATSEATDTHNESLVRPLEQLLAASTLAEYILRTKRSRPIPSINGSGLKMGEVQMRIRRSEDLGRYEHIMRWRAASTLGLKAVAGTNPELAENIKEHLNVTLGKRLELLLKRRGGGRVVGQTRGYNKYEDSLVGLGNPFTKRDKLALGTIINSTDIGSTEPQQGVSPLGIIRR